MSWRAANDGDREVVSYGFTCCRRQHAIYPLPDPEFRAGCWQTPHRLLRGRKAAMEGILAGLCPWVCPCLCLSPVCGLDIFGNAIIELVRSWNELVILTSLQEVYGLIGFTPLLMYTCFSLLVVWRCGRNTSWVGWTILARSMVALTVLFTGATVLFCVWKVF